MNLNAAELFSLQGKTVVLTGASGFLGKTFAQTMLANGARLVALGRSEKLEACVEEWRRAYGPERVCSYRVDMYDLDALSAVLQQVCEKEARVDVVINNAHELGPATGFNTPAGSLENCSADQWTRHLMGGVYWPMLTTQKLGAKMKEQKAGSIVNISSMYGVVAPSPRLYEGTDFMNPAGYGASKAAMLGFTRYVASFWGPYGIRANALVPGPFSNTEDAGPNSVQQDSPFLEKLRARTCLSRIGRPRELAGALLFLASDASTYMTGQAVIVDGGWTVI